MTDGKGRTVDFKNTVIIMTSNIASQLISEMGDRSENDVKIQLKEHLKQYFRPEFLNRLDDIIIFHRLTKEQIKNIIVLQLELLKMRLNSRNIKIDFSESVVSELAELGFDPQFGARPLKRVIQKEIENKLAVQILEGNISSDKKIKIDFNGTEFIFR